MIDRRAMPRFERWWLVFEKFCFFVLLVSVTWIVGQHAQQSQVNNSILNELRAEIGGSPDRARAVLELQKSGRVATCEEVRRALIDARFAIEIDCRR